MPTWSETTWSACGPDRDAGRRAARRPCGRPFCRVDAPRDSRPPMLPFERLPWNCWPPPRCGAGGIDSGRPPGWRIVKSGAGRVGGGCPSGRGSVARISGRCTGPSSRSFAISCRRPRSSCVSWSNGRIGVNRPPRAATTRSAAASLVRRSTSARLGAVHVGLRVCRLVRHALGRSGRDLRVERRRCSDFRAGAAPWRACIRARRRTSCSASASRRRQPSRRRRGWSAAARADSNRPECHQAEAGAAASKAPDGSSLAGKGIAKGERNLSRAGFEWQ